MDKLEFVIPQETAVAVEYPGFVRDTSRAVQTLGGMDAIAAAVTIHGHHLRLRHRPEDRTSHPLYAERVEPTRLVLRISRASAPAPAPAPEANGDTAAEGPSSSAPEPMATSEASETPPVSVSMVARVTQTFRFPGLADFAFLPNDPLLGVRSREKIPYEQRAERTEPAHAVQPFLLIPQLFSWLDMPQDYAFRQPQGKAQARAAHTDRSEPHWGDAPVISFYAEGVPPPVSNPAAALTAAQAAAEVKAKALATKAAESKAVAAGAAAVSSVAANTPAAAEAANTAAQAAAAAEADAQAAAAALAELQDTGFVKAVGQEVEALLAQRPVWGLELLRERVAASPAVVAAAAAPDRVDAARVEQAVRRLCYRFKTGPWRGLFIRRGFDPRIQVEARQHQALVYTLPHNWYRNLLRAAVRATRQQLQGQGAGAAGSARAPGEGKPEGQAAAGEGAEGSQQAPAGAEAGVEGTGAAAGGGGAAPAPAMGALATSALAPVSMDDLHNFRALPTQASSTFQLCDLRLPEVQAVLQGPLPEDGARCSEKTGWFSNSEQQSMQAAVQKRFALLMDQMAPPGAAATAKKGAAAAAKAAGGSGAAADGAAGADVEMADAAAAGEGPSAEGQQAAEGGAADAAAANRAEAIRALMAEMKLGGMGAEEDAAGEADGDGEAEGEGDDGAAARAAARSAAAAAEIANLFGDEDEEEADFPLLDDTGAETAGEEADAGADVSPTAGVRRRRSSIASADGTPGEEGYVGYDSAYETEYADDMEGDDDDEDEDEEDEEDEDGQGSGRRAGGAGVVSGAESDGYGRVTVPYDGATVGRGVSMFGSDDDDYGDAYD
ncbi:hypothetical protein HYH03_001470 [Edaphochlamys debaryana]|uniref:Transcription factor IIIC subunit 5 HTH domain-containing protein n=1 Tax=Edaphochlamys debaryana TaxID=47281 RepID=A0A835YLF4_9CHLO|nr:hypothetical protein HYH03_001470 [Edaphochlamys debaryana]|eukprot:KAG2500705.1 hypothetical protein HYH03_001470 [Edaphochlamys debaryana]